MKQRAWSLLLALVLAVGLLPAPALAVEGQEQIVILYENDVHCAVEGYSRLAAMKKELQQTHRYVGVVSSGDFIQGSSLGVISQGEYIVELMDLVGYDAVALGNHEFDYRLDRLEELTGMMDTRPVCCNFRRAGQDTPYFRPWSMVSYGDTDIAYIGITTPSTIARSSPAQFKDGDGEYIYTFSADDLHSVVQGSIDQARAAGADYVIALSHLGYKNDDRYADMADVESLIRSTHGLDVVLDGHSHSVIEAMTIPDKGGREVLLSSTGTKFEHIGKLTISPDGLTTQLIKTEDYPHTDPAVDAHIAHIQAEYSKLGERKVAVSTVDLVTQDAQGNRLVRVAETNLGDLCADALRSLVDADIGYINGGGLRADITAGDITFNDLLSVFPFNNMIVLAQVDGQTVKDLLEMAMMSWPEEGSFPHVSGLTFSFNTAIPSSVVLNETEEFSGLSGPYRVYDIKVYDRQTDTYKPLELTKTYTIASHNYYLIEHGSGMKMLEGAVVLRNDGTLDVEALERYIVEDLGGVIGEQYGEVSPSITFTDGELSASDAPNSTPLILWAAAGCVVLLLALVLLRARRKK